MGNATDILFGKTRQAVLARLFDLPESSFYLRELSRQSGISPGALQHELKQLLEADLILRVPDGNRIAYRANTEHPIYSELHKLVRKTCGLTHQIQRSLESLAGQISFAALYGSTAKRTDHAHSDIDLLIVGDVTLSQVLESVRPLETLFDREISVRIFHPDDFRQRRLENQPFLQGVLNGPLDILIGQIDDT